MKGIQDRGSTPLASTSLRQGFGWQAGALAKAARQSREATAGSGPSSNPLGNMYYVYLLRSRADSSRTYIGLTDNLRIRLAKHNEGGSPHTAKHRPWELVTYLAFSTREQAADFEGYLKTGSGRAFAKKRLW